jgi:hypothetical protein
MNARREVPLRTSNKPGQGPIDSDGLGDVEVYRDVLHDTGSSLSAMWQLRSH